jgi:hypothetical protein
MPHPMLDEPILTLLLKVTGLGMVALSLAHLPIGRVLGWDADVKQLKPENAAVFHSHLFFLCFALVLLGVALLSGAEDFVERSALGKWISGMLLVFWSCRLYRQWFGFPQELWRGKPFETKIHLLFTLVWICVVTVFGLLFGWQMKWII